YTATPRLYPLSLHDALPISAMRWVAECAFEALCSHAAYRSALASAWWHLTRRCFALPADNCVLEHARVMAGVLLAASANTSASRSEEHTSELQSRSDLVCRL